MWSGPAGIAGKDYSDRPEEDLALGPSHTDALPKQVTFGFTGLGWPLLLR